MQSLQNTQTRPHPFTFPEWFRFSLLTALVGKLVVDCWFGDTRVVDSVILNTVHVEDHFTRKGQSFHAGLLNEKHLYFYFWLKYESIFHNNASSQWKSQCCPLIFGVNSLIHILDKSVLINSFILASQDVNWWTGVVWIIVMFLSDSHSDGTHSLQRIHWCNATFLQTWWRHKLELGCPEDEHILSKFSFLGELYL